MNIHKICEITTHPIENTTINDKYRQYLTNCTNFIHHFKTSVTKKGLIS